MRHHYRYFALIAYDHPVDNPLMVVRVGKTSSGRIREDRYRPSYGWSDSDPTNREWFVNVAITEEQANRLLSGLGDDDPGDDRTRTAERASRPRTKATDPGGTTTRSRPTSTRSKTR
jgi:hypothetical protein